MPDGQEGLSAVNGRMLSINTVTAREAHLCGERGSPAVSGLSFFADGYKAPQCGGKYGGRHIWRIDGLDRRLVKMQ